MKGIANRKILLLTCIIVFTSIQSQAQYSECENLRSEWIRKRGYLIHETNSLSGGKLLNQEKLRRVIYPEFVTYDPNADKFEAGIVKVLYQLNIEKFKTISIGPFQMQLKFIKTILDNTPKENIDDSILLICKDAGYAGLTKHVNDLSKLQLQWRILILFEDFCIKRNILKNKDSLNEMINYYNSGTTSNSQPFFSKIKCNKKTYLSWSNFIADIPGVN